MKVLVINCGSSSLKYQVLDMSNEAVIAKGLVERIGIDGSILTHEKDGADKFILETPMGNHKDAISHVLNTLIDATHGVVKSMDEISAVGHRVVHGAEYYAGSVMIDDSVMKALNDCVALAPLHNPPNILGIEACKELMPSTPMVGVFDTAFHQTMQPDAYIYALPYEFYEKYKVRRYGFHGTSHKYVSERAAAMLGKPVANVKVITCHLGNGASISAIDGGKSVTTSMGFTPLEGCVMGTRSGDLDPAILAFIGEKEGMTSGEVSNALNKNSGVLGISGISSDFRDIEAAASEGNVRAQLALDVFSGRVKAYIGAYLAKLNGADAIVFTAGVGENGIAIREGICRNMENIGIKIDTEKNKVRGKETLISADDSKIKILLIPTNEELVIARDTAEIVKKG